MGYFKCTILFNICTVSFLSYSAVLIESHAYTMPIISQVHYIYTKPITTIKSDLRIDPSLSQMSCVTVQNILNNVNIIITGPNAFFTSGMRAKCNSSKRNVYINCNFF